MRYAVFTDIHANLEALEAVLAKIDELAKEEPIDQIWFLGDLVGYGPNPNECIVKLRERTDVIIAGNHDWAAVGKIDLEDFSAAARISAEWTAEQLTQEHRDFLTNLPERIEHGECTLVHGSPYGPLWEYLTSEVLAERSFQYFNSRFCLVGHTHVPVIFQQPDSIANTPTLPLNSAEQHEGETDIPSPQSEERDDSGKNTERETSSSSAQTSQEAVSSARVHVAETTPETSTPNDEDEAEEVDTDEEATESDSKKEERAEDLAASAENAPAEDILIVETEPEDDTTMDVDAESEEEEEAEVEVKDEPEMVEEMTSQEAITNAEERLNGEIEELLALLGLSQSMVQVTNEMIVPPQGRWEAASGHRAIINPGGVGQPRDGDPRAAFMIYDTECGFTFYRIPYEVEKTQEKIIKAGLPQYLAARLAYGR